MRLTTLKHSIVTTDVDNYFRSPLQNHSSQMTQSRFQSGWTQGVDFCFDSIARPSNKIKYGLSILHSTGVWIEQPRTEIDALLDIQSNSKSTHAGPLYDLVWSIFDASWTLSQGLTSHSSTTFGNRWSVELLVIDVLFATRYLQLFRVRALPCARTVHPKPTNVSWEVSRLLELLFWEICWDLKIEQNGPNLSKT
jgi:hypothetical protein